MLTLLPLPQKYNVADKMQKVLAPAIYTDVAEWHEDVETFCDYFEKINDVRLSVEKADGILVQQDPSLQADAYTIDSTKNAVILRASAQDGLRYGFASLLQLLKCKDGNVCIESLQIEDAPAKEYRGFMLDTVSQPYSLSQVFKCIDLCYFYKVNYLHLHFADGAAYRYPSRAYPSLPSKIHYSFEEIAELRRYASNRGIVLIPEFECPGHATILNRTYPELFLCDMEEKGEVILSELGDPINPESLICAGSEKAFEAIRQLLAELAELFPESPYIHIGGDEAPHEGWMHCKTCLDYMKKHGLKNSGELYSEFVGRVASCVLELGKTPIVWEGFPKESSHFVPKETIVIAWESHYQLAPDLLENGFRIINASWQPTYFVPSLVHRWGPKDLLDWDPHLWLHWWEHSAAHETPIRIEPTESLLGASLCAWGISYELLSSRLMENMPAFSQSMWSPDRKEELSDYEVYNAIYKTITNQASKLLLNLQ